MMFFSWDEVNRLENKAEEALKQARTGDFRAEVDKYIDEVEDLFEMDYMYGVDDVNENLGVSIDPDFEEVREAINKEIDGKDYRQRLEDYFRDGTPYDIARVVSTDAHRIYNEAMFNTAKRGGATKKTWNTMGDEKVRDLHDYLDGMTIPIDAEFYTYNGDHAYYPSQFGVAEEDCNCRCWVTFSK